MSDLRKMLARGVRILFDGAMGTELQKKGLKPGVGPEEYCLANPSVLDEIYTEYIRAGATVLTTNTFGGTKYKLPHGILTEDFNVIMARAARNAADRSGEKLLVAGSIGPTGLFLRPVGSLSFPEMVTAFQEQMHGLLKGGVDFFLIETQFDLAEARAAVIAARRICNLPIAVSMTYERGATLTGSSVAVCTATLCNMGVDMVGMNCSAGPLEMKDAVAELLKHAHVPVLVQPNAGLPELSGEDTVFPMQAEEFAVLTAAFGKQGVQAVGGCCGTTPDHIKRLKEQLEGLGPVQSSQSPTKLCVTSRSQLVHIGPGYPVCLIGERINPTGKKGLTAELQTGEFTTALRFAEEQAHAGAMILDVNVGAPLVDEVSILPDLVERLCSSTKLPLALDSSNPEAIQQALTVYPGSPLVNSISGEEGRLATLGPLCRDFGAPFILLPLKGKNLPLTAKDRISIIENLLKKIDDLNIPRSLVLVDILALSISSTSAAALECIKFIRFCRENLELPTVCGLSNISFGLPARDLINAQFLTLAAGAGMNSCIANPSSPRVAEAAVTVNLLQGHDPDAVNFIAGFSGWSHEGTTITSTQGVHKSKFEGKQKTLEQAVIEGAKDQITGLVQSALDAGENPFVIVGKRLIPAITHVGELYEKKEYFLPQLIRSAETMQCAFSLLRPLLQQHAAEIQRPPIILATVEGDIHDIGKNIVGLLMGNHGFQVIDLGKDVAASAIVEEAQKHQAALIGLSALMTTTMVRMKDTVDLLAEQGIDKKVIIGGAVVTDAFAQSIGAYYAKDAVEAVRLAKKLVGFEMEFFATT